MGGAFNVLFIINKHPTKVSPLSGERFREGLMEVRERKRKRKRKRKRNMDRIFAFSEGKTHSHSHSHTVFPAYPWLGPADIKNRPTFE